MKNIVEVKSPVFTINLNNPFDVSYEGKEDGNWKNMIVSTWNDGVPEPKENEILYKYTDKRGALFTLPHIEY